MAKADIPSLWRGLVASIGREKGVVMVLGGVDTGKTFLSHFLIKEFVENGVVAALVDGDIGQSTIGPPTTIGIALFKEVPEDFEKVRPLFMRFVGSTSPVGHLLQTLTGLKKMVDKALQLGAEIVVVDTTGFVSGDMARELKFQKIDLVGPRHIVALERGDELESIIEPYSARDNMHVHRLKPARGVNAKTQSEREKNRERKFRCYFEEAGLKEFGTEKFRLHGMIPEFGKERLKNLLIALCDRNQDVLALGIVEGFSSQERKIVVRTPLTSMEQVNSIQLGTLRIRGSGEQVR